MEDSDASVANEMYRSLVIHAIVTVFLATALGGVFASSIGSFAAPIGLMFGFFGGVAFALFNALWLLRKPLSPCFCFVYLPTCVLSLIVHCLWWNPMLSGVAAMGGMIVATLLVSSFIPDIAREGFCRKCGYCLTGNTTGVCPECGTHIVDSGGGS